MIGAPLNGNSPPPDELWWIPGKRGAFMTCVMVDNLNFSNTPLEHRYNLYTHNTDPELKILARNEGLLWEGARKTFVPFKTPYPQGYQGVWMSLSLTGRGQIPSCRTTGILSAHDEFTLGHVLELGWGY